jgi:hypothetical protein
VHVHVIQHTGAGRLPEIDPHVDPMRAVRVGQRKLGAPRQIDQLAEFFVRRSGQRGDVAIRHDQQVAVVVRIQVEDDVAGLTAKDDERRLPEGCRVVS